MGNNWKTIWNRRSLDPAAPATLGALLAADGYASPFAGITDEAIWRGFVTRCGEALGVAPGDTVFEVGCGAGAFLHPFFEGGHRVGGLDYSQGLVDAVRAALPGGAFSVGEAADLEAEPRYDIVVACGVFLYFQDEAYALKVLRRMMAKARKGVGILDVADRARQEEAMRYRIETIGKEEYDRNYRDLGHLYLPRDWFAAALADQPARVRVEDQAIPGYGNTPYRFNVFIRKD